MSLLHGADISENEKNLHAAVPPALLEKAQATAKQEDISLDKLVSEAIASRLERLKFKEVLAFGKRHAEARGLKPSDVEEAITAVRAEAKKYKR